MPEFSIQQLSRITGNTRETVGKYLEKAPHKDGKKGAKLYESAKVLALRDFRNEEGPALSGQEAARQLSVARKQQIELEMEVLRKERIPLEVIAESDAAVFSNIAGLLKAHEGKLLDEILLADIFTELRQVGVKIRDGSDQR